MKIYGGCLLMALGVACGEGEGADTAASTSQRISADVSDAAILAPAGNDIIRVQSSPRVAGAIDSLRWGGHEFINSSDHGRQLQVAYVLDNKSECYNPTEAGSWNDGSGARSSSVLLRYQAAGNLITSQTNPAFWLAPGTVLT